MKDDFWLAVALAMAVGVLLILPATCIAQGTLTANVDDRRTLLLPYSTFPATLLDCDRAWRAQRERRPPNAVVVNRTMCEPRTTCQYGTQVWERVCYRVDRKPRGRARPLLGRRSGG